MISVIIPVYNTPQELFKCLKSLDQQTYKDFEVIVVDDGSQPPINVNLYETSLNIKWFRIEHGGAPRARNFGFKKSQGQFVLFCDADMELRADCLQKMLDALKNNPSQSYCYSDFKYGWKKFKFWPFDAQKLKTMNYVSTCSLLRRQDFPGFDESLEKFQDWDLWLTLLDQGKTGVYLPEVLFKANLKHGTMSHWLPRFVYPLPWLKLKNKEKYEKWKKIIQKKHLITESPPTGDHPALPACLPARPAGGPDGQAGRPKGDTFKKSLCLSALL